MSWINWEDRGHVLAVIGLIATLVLGIPGLLLSADFRNFAAEHWAYLLFMLVVLILLYWVRLLCRANALLNVRFSNPRFGRFEQLTRVEYGHVRYYPFMDYERPNHKPTGVGLRVLGELFETNVLSANPDASTWGDMIDRLIKGDFDIIATPLFETRERSRRVAFSTPLFFADIGIYLRKEDANGNVPFALSRAKDQLKVLARTIHAEVIIGEISEKMINKYVAIPDERITYLSSGQAEVSNLFRNLLDHNRRADVVFAERFFADSSPEVKSGRAVNILRAKELLYPVGFAMRREDYVLRNYINIKLMELDDREPNRLMGFIINELKSHPGFEWIDLNNALDYFVREKSV